MMLDAVLRKLKRLRPDDEFVKCVCPGTYRIEGGKLAASFLGERNYYCVFGSDFNDGAHGPEDVLEDETFDGSVWVLRLPAAFLQLVSQMEEWEKKRGDAARSPFLSESFKGYSYTKFSNPASGGAVTVWSAFEHQLNAWRKI